MWRNTHRMEGAVDVTVPAGGAVVFNNCNMHAGTVRRTDRHRRSFGLCVSPPPPRSSTARHDLTRLAAAHRDFGLRSQELPSAEEQAATISRGFAGSFPLSTIHEHWDLLGYLVGGGDGADGGQQATSRL